MTKREVSEPQVYQFRVFIQKVSPSIWRRLHLRDDQTLAVFHDALQIVFGWSDEFLHRFQFRGRIYTVPRAFGTAYTKSAEEVTIRELNLRPQENVFCTSITLSTGGRYKFGSKRSCHSMTRDPIPFALMEAKPDH